MQVGIPPKNRQKPVFDIILDSVCRIAIWIANLKRWPGSVEELGVPAEFNVIRVIGLKIKKPQELPPEVHYVASAYPAAEG